MLDGEVEPEGHRGEILRGKALAGPEVGVRGVHLDSARTHGVEALECWNELAGTEVLDLQPSAGHLLDALGEVLWAAGAGGVEGCTRRVCVGHAPVEGFLGAHDGGRGKARGSAAEQPCLHKGTALHWFPPLVLAAGTLGRNKPS